MSRSDFFQNAFGFEEQAEYAVNQKLLLSKAVFETSSINVEIPLVSPYSETKSNITAVVVKERCRIFHSDLCDYDEDPRSNTPGKANLSTPFDRTASSTCKTNDHFYLDCGTSWTPSVEELRSQVRETLENKDVQRLLQPFRDAESEEPRTPPSINRTNKHQKFVKLSHVIGDSRTLHTFPTSRYGLFQAASQFNYLEFPSPDSIPENGITKYIYDPTQGPACAIACAAGTAYRNYLATVCPDYLKVAAAPTGFGATRGQRCDIQFNGLDDIERYLASIATDVGNQGRSDDSTRGFHPSNRSYRGMFFDVRNGYVDTDKHRIESLNKLLDDGGVSLREVLISKLRIFVQEDTEVTDVPRHGPNEDKFLVTQTYNSALSIGYSRINIGWEKLALIILSGTYEATLLMAILQTVKVLKRIDYLERSRASDSINLAVYEKLPPIYLTKVGGGVFGNHYNWIIFAMKRAITIINRDYKFPLRVLLVHMGAVEECYKVAFP